MLYDLALAFSAHSGLRKLVIGLGEALDRHLPIVEMELAQRRGRDRALLLVVAPDSGRRWMGERSQRVLEAMRVDSGRLVRCDDEVGRVGIDPIAARLRMVIGDDLVGVAFSKRALDRLEQADATAMLIAVLEAHTRRSTWLMRTAAVSQRAHRTRQVATPVVATPVVATPVVAMPIVATPIVPASAESSIDFAGAQREAIAQALTIARGKIYGPGGAADRLGLKPSTLQSKMRKLGLDRRHFA